MNENTKSLEDTSAAPIELVRTASNRLFIALTVLLAATLAVISLSYFYKHVSVAFLVVPAGMIGGFVGLQRRLKHMSVDDLRLIANSRLYTYLAPLTGGILALLLFVLFLTGLLHGGIFPAFGFGDSATANQLTALFTGQASDPTDYAKLIFWSFVAGYSERFVTDVVSQFEAAALRGPRPTSQGD